MECTGFNGIAMLPKEMEHTATSAEKLSKIVEYG
jgi:hypothetical protein